MFWGRGGRHWVMCGLMLGTPHLVLADAQQFDISAQPLPAALKAFAAQAHIQILYVYNVVAVGRGNAVRGELDTHEALAELLKGTGFEAVYTSETEVTIRLSNSRLRGQM
jgi:outer membrane receptor for ferric coprogen and ferric-rhodotorulic acid